MCLKIRDYWLSVFFSYLLVCVCVCPCVYSCVRVVYNIDRVYILNFRIFFPFRIIPKIIPDFFFHCPFNHIHYYYHLFIMIMTIALSFTTKNISILSSSRKWLMFRSKLFSSSSKRLLSTSSSSSGTMNNDNNGQIRQVKLASDKNKQKPKPK